MPVADLAAPDSALFLWATFPQLPEALRLIEAWGFTYKSVAFVWLKKNKKADSWFYGLGFWTRGNAEIFKKLIDIRKELNIHPLIDIRLLEKTEGDRDISFPRRLIEFAENQKENPEIAFDKERDKMIVVFDGDIFEEKVLDYDELVAEGEKKNILAVSNPAFELFLLLHYENSYEDDIEPNAEQIIQNEKDGHQTFIYKLLLARTGINPKKNSAIGELAKNIEIAIKQEKKINEDIHQCKGQITCNIGRIIDDIRNDDGK